MWGELFLSKVTVNLNQSFLSTLAPAQAAERNIASLLPIHNGGGGARGGQIPFSTHLLPSQFKAIKDNIN